MNRVLLRIIWSETSPYLGGLAFLGVLLERHIITIIKALIFSYREVGYDEYTI